MSANRLKIVYWKVEQYAFALKSKITRLPSHLMDLKRTEVNVIVSLTSYPKKFHSRFRNLKSFLRQSVKPKRIIFWIAEINGNDGQMTSTPAACVWWEV